MLLIWAIFVSDDCIASEMKYRSSFASDKYIGKERNGMKLNRNRIVLRSEPNIHGQKPSRFFLTKFYDRRMFRGDITFVLAAALPFISIALLKKVSITLFFEFVAYELILVVATGMGSKHFRKKYLLEEYVYYYGPHTPVRVLFGIVAVLMVFDPSLTGWVLIIWGIAAFLSMVINLVRGEGRNFWRETLTEFATAIRAGYLLYLLVVGVLYLILDFY